MNPSPQLFFDTINAYQKTSALKAAIDLGFFTAIGADAPSAAELAPRCNAPERGIRILADYLTILGFLTKSEGRYSLTPDSAAFLDAKSPAYVGGAAEFFVAPGIMAGFNDVAATIRKGSVHHSELGTIEPNHPVWLHFAKAMGPMMVPAARGVAELVVLDPSRETKVLDVSASHGMYGIVFAQKNPRAQLVALDWESVLAVASANAKAAGLTDRFSTIAGDAFSAQLGSGYDVVLVPNFLHHFPRADCIRFLERVHAALEPGGRVAIVEFVPNEDRVTPPGAASFSFVMLGTTPAGDAYTFAEYRSMLAEAGFHDAQLHPLLPTAESAVIASR